MQKQVVLQLNLKEIMKILILFFGILIFFGSVSISQSYGFTHNREHPTLPEVSLQLEIRNSQGNLVAYFEPTLMYIIDLRSTHDYLDTIKNKTIISIDDQNFELIQFTLEGRFNNYAQISSMDLVHQREHVLAIRHDGYVTEPGDLWKASWKIIRTIE